MAIEIAPHAPVLADCRQRNRGALRRICAWGGLAAIALVAVAITVETETGRQRLQLAWDDALQPAGAVAVAQLPQPVQVPVPVARNEETERLAAEIKQLAADRERLTARIASLEHNLNDMTGSIKEQARLAALPRPAPPAPPPQPSAPATAPPAVVAAAAPPIAAPPSFPPLTPPAVPVSGTATPWTDVPQPLAAMPAPEPVPLPPVRVASAPTSEAAPAFSPKTEFGVDLGSAPSLEVLGTRWAAVKANYGPLLSGLRPLAARDRRPGATDYRLIVGPLPSTTAARALCGRFAAVHAACRATRFEGEQWVQR